MSELKKYVLLKTIRDTDTGVFIGFKDSPVFTFAEDGAMAVRVFKQKKHVAPVVREAEKEKAC